MYTGSFVGLHVVRSYPKYDLVQCPYHDDTHPSGLFWKESGDYYCPACKTSRRIRELLVDMGREDEYEGYVAAGAPFFNLLSSVEPQAAQQFVSVEDDEMALAYIDGRRVPLTVAQSHGLLYHPPTEELVFQTGVNHGWVGRSIVGNDGPRYRIHGEKGPYWPHTADVFGADHVVLSEGPFKAMMLSQVVEPGAVSVASMGSNPSLIFWQTFIQLSSTLTLIADKDEPGKKFAKECKRRLPAVRVFFPPKPFDNMTQEEAFETYANIFSRLQKGGF